MTTIPVTSAPVIGGTAIEWADYTFNPWWGCVKVAGSPACVHCYAETWAKRWKFDVWGQAKDRRFFGDAHWNEPRKWDRKAAKEGVRRTVFCASMGDVFEDRTDLDEHRARLWEVIERTPNLDWLLLTKRPEHILRMVPRRWLAPRLFAAVLGGAGWPSNAWVGTTVENQQWADIRIPHLLDVPAPVRFLSVEPMAGPVDLGLGVDHSTHERDYITTDVYPQCLDCSTDTEAVDWTIPARSVDWVICGGESGPRAKPMHPDWPRSLRDQCAKAGVPFLFKQWGEWLPYELDPQPPFWQGQVGDLIDGHLLPADLSQGEPVDGWWATDLGDDPGEPTIYRHAGKKAAGRLLDGRTWDEVPG